MSTHALGIDVGGSGIKGAVVDLQTGEFSTERHKIKTPKKSTPEAVAEVIKEIVEHFDYQGEIGVTLPAVIQDQVARSAANIDKEWIGTNVNELLARHLPDPTIAVLNDADAAGLAEVEFGLPEARTGTTLFLTFGTGIGSALLIDGTLVPNTELGHLIVEGEEAEKIASSAAKDREELSYKKWSKRVTTVLQEYERLINPTQFVVGGGISREHEKWVPRLEVDTPVLPAQLLNRAGIVGAALAAAGRVTP
ncbi:polyphosphate--glucose phosphotransferase [Corynebacterium tapiri]|uniref:ROK family protein n=1 Tax=Corynebacterium tapiri TaxID=1448266 RepID=A0A5C4U5X2_9CORY|nr:ROK family protein [Corynebacterium tapiri]TNL99197.1 ROK family protein [Corynebacterium tapiri]